MNKLVFIFSILVLYIFSMPTENAYASGQVEYLVIGGGGGASTGGGGAGGYLTGTGYGVTIQNYPIIVGAGGAGSTAGVASSDGSDSVFDSITATGGGGGGHNENNGRAGGSGGGGGADSAGGNTGGAGTVGQGNDGGATTDTGSPYAASGGGGAGAAGQGSVADNEAGDGGNGLSSSINGTAITRAGGGGGGLSSAGGIAGMGGTGGGGNGNAAGDGSDGTPNTGGGGGGTRGGTGGDGGSGIVIIRYLTGTITATGGTITTNGGYTIHTFTTSGNFDVTAIGSPPNPVTVLDGVNIGANSLDLEWDAPTSFGAGTFQTYTVNYTTPWGDPVSFLANSTNLYYNVTGLTFGTDYSFRVAARTEIAGNNTGAYILNVTTTSTTYSLPPTSLVATSNSATQIDLQWVASAMDNILGYRIDRQTPTGGAWDCSVASCNTTNTDIFYNNTGLTAGIIYNYRVSAMNGSGFSTVSNTYEMTTFHLPDAVTDLTGSATDLSTIDLSWTAPTSYAPEIEGYMINGTTPTGEPVDILNSNTGTTATTATALNLLIGQEYSFRVSAITVHGKNASGNIWNGSTIQTFVIGNLSNPDITNDDDFSIFFDRTDLNASAIQLDVTYPNSYDLSCDFDYKYARINQTYSSLTTVPDGADDQVATFTLINATGDLVQVYCRDSITGDDSTYVLTITNFPFLEQVNSLRNGEYGTFFQIGAFDGVMLIIIFLGMVGLNRTTPIVGVIFVVITVFTMQYFGLITYPIIMYPAMIMMIVWAFVSTRKDD